MAGLTNEGFTALTHNEIRDRIQAKFLVNNPDFDVSPESPDGQNIEIFSFELAMAWAQLSQVYSSFDVTSAAGSGLENLGHVSGIVYQKANRSYATVNLQGVADTIIPAGSQVSDEDGNIFQTVYDSVVPNTAQVYSVLAGPTPVTIGTLVNIETPVNGWTGILQDVEGIMGVLPETQQQFRNRRTSVVMSPSLSVGDALTAKIVELGISQVDIVINDTDAQLLDGTPSGYIHITVAESLILDVDIARQIMKYKGMGVPTYGSTRVDVVDSKGVSQVIFFTKAAAVDIGLALDVTFLSSDVAGAEVSIREALITYTNDLLAGEDLVWSRLFGIITPYGKAQINSLSIGKVGDTLTSSNVPIEEREFARIDTAGITITVTDP